MSTVKSYPYYRINVDDQSIYIPPKLETLPVFRPLVVSRAAKGPVNEVVYYDDYNRAEKALGKETFDEFDQHYFSQGAYFAKEMAKGVGFFFARVADEKAKGAFMIFEMWVRLVSDPTSTSTNPIDGTPVVKKSKKNVADGAPEKPYLECQWRVRTTFLEKETWEDLTKLQSRKETVDNIEYDVYPMIMYRSTNPGVWGDFTGCKFYYDSELNIKNRVNNLGGVFYTFAPIQRDRTSSIVTPVRDKYNSGTNKFVVRPETIDRHTQTIVSAKEVLERYYTDDYQLPFEVKVYNNYFDNVGDIIMKLENEDRPDDKKILTPYLVNLADGTDLDGKPYKRAIILEPTPENPEPVRMHRDVNHFLEGGADGDICDDHNRKKADTTMEALIQKFYSLDLNPDIVDKARYPFTTHFDPGFHIVTKKSMIKFMNIRDDNKIYISTQQVTSAEFDGHGGPEINSKKDDLSIGSSLRSEALLQRESIAKGTAACRCSIFLQAGIPHNVKYTKWLPATLWTAQKHAMFQNRTYIVREPTGLPLSDISCFKKTNWVPHSEDTKRESWDTGLNYFQYYTRKWLHYAALRSVYPYDTSVLCDDTFTDIITYMKHEVRRTWAKFVGTRRPANVIQEQIEKDLSNRIDNLVRGRVTFTVDAYQTEEEKRLGFVQHVLINVTSPATMRVMDVDIVCYRENYNPETVSY